MGRKTRSGSRLFADAFAVMIYVKNVNNEHVNIFNIFHELMCDARKIQMD